MQACEAERLGAEEGGRAGRGEGEAEGEGGAVRPGAGGGKGRGGSRGLQGKARGWGAGCRAGWVGWGDGRGSLQAAPGTKKKPASFRILQLPPRFSLDSSLSVSLQGERFQRWAPGHRGCRGLPVSAAQRVVGSRGRQREMLSVQWGALRVSRSDPSTRRAEAEPAAGVWGRKGRWKQKCEGAERPRVALVPPGEGPLRSPALEVGGQRGLH